MSSGSKFARGGGRGQFGPPQKRGIIPQRQAPSVKDRIVVVQGKDTAGSINVGNSHSSQEESYQLLASPSATTQPFAMMIRLTPELLDELKQAETEQNVPRMKFGANASGHMIQVGSENFKFSSAPEPGDLCDIYEQRSGENGQQLLVEAGSAWRKLSVQRILSASEKDRVKKRTAEAEKRQRLRKSILVDPSTQMIIPQGTPAEANGRKGSAKTKREPPPKKRRVETIQVPPAAAKPRPQPSVIPLTATQRNLSPATSPVSDPPNYSAKGIPVTQMSGKQPSKVHPPVVDGIAGPAPSKGSSSQKEKAQSTPVRESAPSAKTGAGSMTDLRNFLIGLLQENPKGVTIKAMEKAVAEGLPSNPGRKNIDKVIRTIATFHAPGKYLLNPGVEKGSYSEVTPVSVEKATEQADMGPREEEPFSVIHGETVVEKGIDDRTINRDLSNVAPPQRSSAKEASAQPVESQLSDPKSHGSSPKQSGVDVKAASSGSDSSSSSGSGSDSDSESDSSDSESGSDSGSASGSGSDSDASSSSSDTSMDEDVDIMSDDDNENKSDTKGKVKAKEGKLISKDDSKGEEVFKEDKPRFAEEDSTLKSQEPALVIEKIDICDEVEPTGDVHGNLIKEVFGPDEDVDVIPDTNVSPGDAGLLGSGQSKPHDTPSSRYGKRVTSGSPGKVHVSQREGRKSSSRDAHSKYEQVEKVARANEVDSRALKKGKTSNSALESTRQERVDINVNMRTNNQGLQESKSPIRSGGLAKNTVKDNNTNFVEPEKRDSTKAKVSSDGVVMKSTLSIEASKSGYEGSPMRSKDSLQKVGRPLTMEDSGGKQLLMKQQVNAEVRGSYVKVTQTKDKQVKGAEKHDSEKAPESSFKDKSPEDVSRAGSSANKNREGASKLHDEAGLGADIANQGTRGLRAEHMGFNGRDEDARGKEKASERSTTKATKGGEPSGRQTDLDMKDRQHKDSSFQRAGNKVVVQGSSRDLNQSSGYNREVNKSIRESSNPSRPIKQADESRHIDAVERAGLKVEQAERPLKEVDSTKRLKDVAGKDSLKEAESVGRTSVNGIASGFLPKEGKMTDNIHLDSGRSSYSGVANVVSQDLELGELREPPVDNEPFQVKKSYLRAEDSKSRRGFETTSRVISQKDSTSPDMERFPGFGRGLSESMKQSPYKVGRDPPQCTQDIRTGKRRLEENESFETDRMPKRKVDLVQEKQSLQVKLDKLPTVPAKEDRREKLKSGSSDAREHGAGSSKTASLEANRKKSSKELDDNKNSSFPKTKTTSTPVASKEKHREKAKADTFDGVGKKQTPQSSEVQGNEFFAPYEKKEPELRGPIETYEQYKEYCKEYNEKHPIYIQLNQSLESDKEEFEFLRKQINEAKCKDDKNKLVSLYGRVRKEYSQCHKRYRRMQSTFRLLHQELQAIKLHCKEYAEKVGQG